MNKKHARHRWATLADPTFDVKALFGTPIEIDHGGGILEEQLNQSDKQPTSPLSLHCMNKEKSTKLCHRPSKSLVLK